MSPQITLFDLPTREPRKSWSLNPWKTRLLLNFKGLDYKTEWTEYPDIKPRLQDYLPNKEAYTIPTIMLPDGKYIMDSMEIVKHIEAEHPSPSIHLDSPYILKVRERIAALTEFGTGLRGVYTVLVPERLLNPRSIDYWMETRPKRIGKPLSALTEDEKGGKVWDYAAPNVKAVTEMLKESGEGPFFMGETVSYADFFWVGFLLFFKTIGDDVFEKLISVSDDVEGKENVHLKLLEACKPWSARNDH
ncbi:hypothetical protein BJ170DRAFT_420582 [Xylariales sp. AK1849]|nr:hypothetical protein BJ170DRAFT_420582 [Xylariales sp. AK1849]